MTYEGQTDPRAHFNLTIQLLLELSKDEKFNSYLTRSDASENKHKANEAPQAYFNLTIQLLLELSK